MVVERSGLIVVAGWRVASGKVEVVVLFEGDASPLVEASLEAGASLRDEASLTDEASEVESEQADAATQHAKATPSAA